MHKLKAIRKKGQEKRTLSAVIGGFMTVILLCICKVVDAQENLPVIGVLGLTNGGEISPVTVDSICNKISDLIEQTQKYYVLKREFIPPVLQEQGMTITNTLCSQKEGLAAAGNLLSADQMVGGTISRRDGKFTLDLIRINVLNRNLLSSQQITVDSLLIGRKLPGIVDVLIRDDRNVNSPGSTAISGNTGADLKKTDDKKDLVIKEKKRGKGPLLVILSGIILAGGAAAGAYVYHERNGGGDLNTPDVPLTDLPVRSR